MLSVPDGKPAPATRRVCLRFFAASVRENSGEKALSAMTLLFGLFLHKPTPFCFLDEVDAPLDDANVNRYTSMVRALSDKTQFILITHNHNTMSIADSLYGVTMQEYGVSKILSVKLEQVTTPGR